MSGTLRLLACFISGTLRLLAFFHQLNWRVFSCWKSLAAAATFIPGTLLPLLPPPLVRSITGTLAAILGLCCYLTRGRYLLFNIAISDFWKVQDPAHPMQFPGITATC